MYKFYFPPAGVAGAEPLPSLDDFDQWFRRQAATTALLGPAAWVVQTGLWMRHLGLAAELVHEWPDSGVVVAHSDHLPARWDPRPDRFVVCCLADRCVPHPYADFHVLQNPYQVVRFGPHAYMPHWPQAGLVGRDQRVGPRLQNIRFFGEAQNLAAPLQESSFSDWCYDAGFQFSIPPREMWHDYHDTDVVVAVRTFSSEWTAFEKPATKLFNAWLAGAVPIVGKEAAYAREGRPGKDCFVVENLEELRAVLLRLKQAPHFAEEVRKAGRERSEARSHEALARLWHNLLDQRVAPAAQRWSFRPSVRRASQLVARVKAGLAWRGYLLHYREP